MNEYLIFIWMAVAVTFFILWKLEVNRSNRLIDNFSKELEKARIPLDPGEDICSGRIVVDGNGVRIR